MKYSVIDIGTNSTRLYIEERCGDSGTKLIKELATTRLGEGINKTDMRGQAPVLGDTPMERTSDCVAGFVKKAMEAGVNEDSIFVYATAAVREASNKECFAEMIKEKSGITLDIISGETEAEIAYLGAANNKQGYGVIDIGGGSTEVVAVKSGSLCAVSQHIGGVRLKERFNTNDGRVNTAQVKKYALDNFIPGYKEVAENASGLIGVSGTPTTIASFILNQKKYVPDLIQDYVMRLDKLNEMLELLAGQTIRERIEYSGEFAPRADIITYGGCVLSAFMEYYGFSEITVSDRDSLEGYIAYKLK